MREPRVRTGNEPFDVTHSKACDDYNRSLPLMEPSECVCEAPYPLDNDAGDAGETGSLKVRAVYTNEVSHEWRVPEVPG
jgi:hypothetical protein